MIGSEDWLVRGLVKCWKVSLGEPASDSVEGSCVRAKLSSRKRRFKDRCRFRLTTSSVQTDSGSVDGFEKPIDLFRGRRISFSYHY